MSTIIILVANYLVALVSLLKEKMPDGTSAIKSKTNIILVVLATIVVTTGIYDSRQDSAQMNEINAGIKTMISYVEEGKSEQALKEAKRVEALSSSGFGGGGSW